MKLIKVQTGILLLIIFSQIAVMFFWLDKKEGMHVDEMYSLESAHYLRTNVTRLTEQDRWYGGWRTSEDFDSYFTVNGDESFWKASFRDKLHLIGKISPYKILLNITLSITEGKYSLIQPVLLNVVFFVLIQLILYQMGNYVFENRKAALITPLFFGFTAGAVNMILYIRMYAIIMCFSILMLWLYILLLQENRVSGKTVLLYVSILAISYFSYLCHQYTVLLVAALSMVYCIMQFFYRKWKWGIFHLSLLGCLSGAYVLGTGMWRDFLRSGEENRANEVIKILQGRGIVEWLDYLWNYWNIYLQNALGGIGIFLFMLIVILMAVSYRKGKEDRLWEAWKEKEKNTLLLSFFSSVLYYLILSRIAPSYVTRYISYLFPAAAFILAIFVKHVFAGAPERRLWGVTICAIVAMIVINGKCGYIENIYEELTPIKTILHEEKYQIDSIYVNTTRKPSSLGRHQMYVDGYLWQEGLRYYVATPEMLKRQEAPGIGACRGNAVLLWVARDDDTYEILKDIYLLAGFDTHEKLGYTQESKIYYLTRKQDGDLTE